MVSQSPHAGGSGSSLGPGAVGTFILYVLCVLFSLGVLSALIVPDTIRETAQSLGGPIAALLAAYGVGHKRGSLGDGLPTTGQRLRYAALASAAFFLVLFAALFTVVSATADGLTGLPLGYVAIGFPVIYAVSVGCAYLGVTTGFRAGLRKAGATS